MRQRSRCRTGFTLIEALIAIVLVAIGVVGVFGGIRSLTAVQARAESADLLQRLAAQKLNEISATTTDPTTANAGGDFSDQGYPDINWSVDVEQEDATDIDLVKVTVTRGTDEQTISVLQFVPPQTGSGGGSNGSGGGAAGGAQ